MYSLLANEAQELEGESHRLLLKASDIRDYLKTYEEATDTLDSKERKHLEVKKQTVAFIAPH